MDPRLRVVWATSVLTLTRTLIYFFSVSRRGYFICRDVINVTNKDYASTISLEKNLLDKILVFSSNQEIPTFYGTRRFITSFWRACHFFPVLRQLTPHPQPISKIDINIILLLTPRPRKISLTFRLSHQHREYTYVPHTCNVPHPSHSWFDHPNNWWRVKSRGSSLCSFPQVPWYCAFGTWWHTVTHGGGKWRGKMRMEWAASSLALDDGARSIQLLSADAHTSAASSRLNWHPRRFKWTRPFRWKTKSGFCACAITFRTCYTCLLSSANVFLSTLFLNTVIVKRPSFTFISRRTGKIMV